MTEADFDHCPECGALPAFGIRCHPKFAMRVPIKADPYMLSIYTHTSDELVATYREMGCPPSTDFEKWDGERWGGMLIELEPLGQREERFRVLVARIATLSDEELPHVDAKQMRHIAQVVLLGATPEYPAFAPTDAIILTVVGSRERCNAYWVRNVINGEPHIPGLTTPQIRRRLDKLEKQGKVSSRRWGPGFHVEWSITDAGRAAISA